LIMSRWLSIKSVSEQCDTSPRTIRDWLRKGLRHSRIKGKLLIQELWLDEFLSSFEVNESQVDEIVKEICEDLLT
jgi:hypothetical protein